MDSGRVAPVSDRIANAAAAVIARQGLRDTNVDDIAVAAGCGRATVYRAFPGGRSEVLVSALSAEVDQVFAACAAAVDGSIDLADAIVATLHSAACELAGHDALQRLLADEPGVILPFISFDRVEPLLARATALGAVHFARFLPTRSAGEVGEWCARVVLDHLRMPSAVNDIADAAVARRLVEDFLVPGLVTELAPEFPPVPEPVRST